MHDTSSPPSPPPPFSFLSASCDVEDGLNQLHSCAGQPHIRLVEYTDRMYPCQFISDVTPLKLEQITLGENLTVELSKISFHPFQVNNQLGE